MKPEDYERAVLAHIKGLVPAQADHLAWCVSFALHTRNPLPPPESMAKILRGLYDVELSIEP